MLRAAGFAVSPRHSELQMSTRPSDLSPPACLAAGPYVDSDHPAVQAFARSHADSSMPARDIAVRLYYAVRDGIRYDPYQIDISERGLRASHVLECGYGFCVSKAALLTAAARVLGVPARLGFADVRNHLTSPRLREMMRTDVFAFHGYSEVWLDGRWVKATPAFSKTLCEKAGVRPLEFDGSADSIFHECDTSGRRHMQYLLDRGPYLDVPRDEMISVFEQLYPNYRSWMRGTCGMEFETEVVPGSAE